MAPAIDKRATFSRGDFLALRVLLWLILLGSLLAAVGLPALDRARGADVSWTVPSLGQGLSSPATPAQADNGITGFDFPETVVTFQQPPVSLWLITLLPGLLSAAAVAVGVVMMLRLLRNVQVGKPYSSSSVWSLRVMAVLLILAPVAIGIAGGIATQQVLEHLGEPWDSIEFDFGPTLPLWAAGLFAAALAEVFRQGAQLQSDVDGLV